MLGRTGTSIALALLALAGGGGFAAGLRAYEDGRPQEALAAFRAAEEEQGDDASAALLYDHALAALRVGELLEAEVAAEKAAARGGAGFEPLRDELLGACSFRRCELAAREAEKPDATLAAFERAMVHAADAAAHWRRAAVRRPERAPAVRNAERAVRELERLRALRDAAAEAARDPALDPEAAQRPEERPAELQAQEGPLDAQGAPDVSEGAAQLLELLARKEAEKRALRRTRRAARSVSGEKDW